MKTNVIAALLILLQPLTALAAPVSNLTDFQPDTPAKAAEVNGNFNQVKNAVGDNDLRASKLEEDYQTLTDNLNDALDRIAKLESDRDQIHAFVVELMKYTSVETHNTKPLIMFSGVNVMITNGSGKSVPVPDKGNWELSNQSPNGLGNLIIGYDEFASGNVKTGAHNLVIGAGHAYSSYGGIVSGYNNAIGNVYASAISSLGSATLGFHSSTISGDGNFIANSTSSTVRRAGLVNISGWKNKNLSWHQSVMIGGRDNTITDNTAYSGILGNDSASNGSTGAWWINNEWKQ